MMTVHGGKIHNPEWKWVFASSVSALFFVVLIFAAGAFMECMNGGCAVVFTSIFLAITSAAVAFLFFTRARSMDGILAGKNLLVRWIYPADLAATTAMEEFASYKEANRSLLSIVAGFFLIAIVLLLLFGGEAGGMTAGVMCIILAILALVAWGAPRLEYSRALKAIPEAYISRNGIIFEGTVYPFRSFLNNLQEVGFSKGTRNHPALIHFSFLQLVGLYILRPYRISVPVPEGEEEQAQIIVRELGGNADPADEPPR